MSYIKNIQRNFALTAILVAGLAVGPGKCGAADDAKLAREIVKSSGVKGGLCVHVGVTDGRLTAELAFGGRFMVHGLSDDDASVKKARKHIRPLGLEETGDHRQARADTVDIERSDFHLATSL